MQQIKIIFTIVLIAITCNVEADVVGEIVGLQFRSNDFNSQGSVVEIDLQENVTFQVGITVCLRAKFEFWNRKYLFQNKKFSILLSDLENFFGFVNLGDVAGGFKFPSDLRKTLVVWNSFCLVFDRIHFVVNVVINDNWIETYFEKKFLMDVNLTEDKTISLGNFSGKITDLNIWDFALTVDNVKEFSDGCNRDWIKTVKPNSLDWSKLNFSRISDGIQKIQISTTNLCNNNQGILTLLYIDQ